MEPRAANAPDVDHSLAGAMSRELHKTAQPLTVLQGLLDLMLTRISTGVTSGKSLESVSPEAPHSKSCHECKCSLERARDEVSRLTSTFEDVRKLAGLQQPARDVTTFALSPVVTDSLQNLGNDFCAGDITVVMDACPDEDPRNVMVKASVSRLSAAIRLVLTALAKCLEAGGRIRVSIDTSDTNAVISFRPSRMRSTPEHDLLSTLNSELLYANLMLATVGGQLHFDKTTDIVVLLLPTVTSKTAVTMGSRDSLYV